MKLARCRLRLASAVVLGVAFSTSACTERGVTEPEPVVPEAITPVEGVDVARIHCQATLATETVMCGTGLASATDIIVGGQNLYVRMTGSNIVYNGGTGQFTFDATLENLIPQPLGTTDGATMSPTSVFFASLPAVTSGTGTVSVVPAGFGSFTSVGQPYYSYPYILAQNDVSPAQQWTFIAPPSVTTFEFTVLVNTPVQWPDGYVALDGKLPGADYGIVHPNAPAAMTATVHSAVGNVLPGTPVFETSDAACATVDGTGTITGTQAGTCTINVTAGSRTGSMTVTVSGMERVWNGSVSSAWETPANWNGGLVPVAADSVHIPQPAPNYPVLGGAAAVARVLVDDGAGLSLGNFQLTANSDVSTGTTGGIVATGGRLRLAGATGTLAGRIPRTDVAGSYTLVDRVYATGTVTSLGFSLTSANSREFSVITQ